MKRIALIAITLLLAHPSANADFPKGMYDFAELKQEQVRYERVINEFYQKTLLPRLDKQDRDALSGKANLDFGSLVSCVIIIYNTNNSLYPMVTNFQPEVLSTYGPF